MSEYLRGILETHGGDPNSRTPQDLVFKTRTGTPLSSKNLYNRVLAPACDRIKQPRVSWHSFRHTHATLLADVGESIETAQALLGHSDLGTTLDIHAHAIPDSQRALSSLWLEFCSRMFSSWKTAQAGRGLTDCVCET